MSDPCEVFKTKFDAMNPEQLEDYWNRLSKAAGIIVPSRAMRVESAGRMGVLENLYAGSRTREGNLKH
jgi:hypothetical protein